MPAILNLRLKYFPHKTENYIKEERKEMNMAFSLCTAAKFKLLSSEFCLIFFFLAHILFHSLSRCFEYHT